MARIALALLVVLLGCSTPASPGSPSLSGTWNIAAPSSWSTFRLTLTQTGNAVSGSAVVQTTTSTALWSNGNYTIHGTAAVDTLALDFGGTSYNDGSNLYLYGRTIVAGSLRGTLVFRDASGIDHPVSQYGELDRNPTELHFNK
jgi:hypothetical protein